MMKQICVTKESHAALLRKKAEYVAQDGFSPSFSEIIFEALSK